MHREHVPGFLPWAKRLIPTTCTCSLPAQLSWLESFPLRLLNGVRCVLIHPRGSPFGCVPLNVRCFEMRLFRRIHSPSSIVLGLALALIYAAICIQSFAQQILFTLEYHPTSGSAASVTATATTHDGDSSGRPVSGGAGGRRESDGPRSRGSELPRVDAGTKGDTVKGLDEEVEAFAATLRKQFESEVRCAVAQLQRGPMATGS